MSMFERALQTAWRAAQEVATTYPENKYGSCNFDAAYIPAKRDSAKTRERIEAMRFRARYYKGWGFLLYPQEIDYPQSPEWRGCREARRTAVAETIARTLKDAGVPAGVYYQMD